MKILSLKPPDAAAATSPSEEQMKAMFDLINEMKSKGVLLSTGGHSPDTLEITVTRSNGQVTIADVKPDDLIGGFALLDVKDRDEAIYWTNRILDLMGDGTYILQEVNTFD